MSKRYVLDEYGEPRAEDDLLTWWETIIFSGECDQYQDRYTNREDALAGRAKALEMAKSSCLTPPPNHPQKEP